MSFTTCEATKVQVEIESGRGVSLAQCWERLPLGRCKRGGFCTRGRSCLPAGTRVLGPGQSLSDELHREGVSVD